MFKKNYLIWMNAIIVFLFLCSFVLIQYNDTRYYNELASVQVKNDVKLAADNIRVGLESVTSQQRIVAETMSNDLYLRNWLLHEPDRSYNHRVPKTLRQALLADDSDWAYNYHDLYSYLKNYQQNYGYTNVFLVSTKTGCYYYNDGLNKVVNKKSHFDSWYYNFLDLKKNYDIQFDRDETTRLPNRKSFRYIYEKKVKRRKRRVYSLAMIDVDNFKVYNDTQGHLYGNAILHYVAVHLKEMFQDIGVVARWGGDEFILLSYQSPARTKDLVDRLNTYLKEQTEIASISLSVGVTVIDPKHPLEDIMENADKALYAAKEAGKGCSRIY